MKRAVLALLMTALCAFVITSLAAATEPEDVCPSGPVNATEFTITPTSVSTDDAVCQPPSAWIAASPNPVPVGGNTTLSWGSSNAEYGCNVSSPFGSFSGQQDSRTVGPVNSSFTASITCSNSGGSTTSNVTVTTYSASPPPPPPPPPPSPPPANTNNAAFVSQTTITEIGDGETKLMQVTMQNTGSTTWTSANGYRLGTQNPEDNTTWGLSRVELPSSVSPGGTVTFSFNIIGPAVPEGTPNVVRNLQFRMVRDGVQWFGASTPNQSVTVTESAARRWICNAKIEDAFGPRLNGGWLRSATRVDCTVKMGYIGIAQCIWDQELYVPIPFCTQKNTFLTSFSRLVTEKPCGFYLHPIKHWTTAGIDFVWPDGKNQKATLISAEKM